MKLFITGVHSSGKTTLANKIAMERKIPYKSYDQLFDYTFEEEQFDGIVSSLPEDFVIDAIPLDKNLDSEDLGWGKFKDYEQKNECSIVCVYCPDAQVWLNRVKEKEEERRLYALNLEKSMIPLQKRIVDSAKYRSGRFAAFLKMNLGRIKRLVMNPSKIRKIPSYIYGTSQSEDVDIALIPEVLNTPSMYDYLRFHLARLEILKPMRNVRYYDSIANEYTSYEEAVRRLNLPYLRLYELFFNGIRQKTYDALYQDVEMLKMVGYSISWRTWENIASIVNWVDKKVVDIGCFHGYFSFKIEEAGAKQVIGLDKHSVVLNTTHAIAKLIGSKAKFQEWTGGDDFPECDIILLLNVLHHFGDLDFQRQSLEKIRTGTQVVFEVNANQISMIKELFEIQKEQPSHRLNRTIFLALRK